MITIIGITFLFYLVAEIVKQSAVNKARKREMARQARIREEMRRDKEERQRIAAEQKAQREAMIEYHRQLAEHERELRRQAAEQARLVREQQKQAEQIAKQEIRLLALEQKMTLAERDEKHYSDEVTAITIDMRGLEAYIQYMKSKGLPCKTKEAELEKLSKKLYAAETKVIKARQARELCERQMQTA